MLLQQTTKFDIQHILTQTYSDILLLGNVFYTYYAYLFLIAGLILLTAMVGSIVLALSTKEKTDEIKLNDNYLKQNSDA